VRAGERFAQSEVSIRSIAELISSTRFIASQEKWPRRLTKLAGGWKISYLRVPASKFIEHRPEDARPHPTKCIHAFTCSSSVDLKFLMRRDLLLSPPLLFPGNCIFGEDFLLIHFNFLGDCGDFFFCARALEYYSIFITRALDEWCFLIGWSLPFPYT
jgi:hypothetical protein